jgi:hypothetical protein
MNIDNPERGILADRETLARVKKLVNSADHPLARAAYEPDIRYLRGLIETYERAYFIAHGLND